LEKRFERWKLVFLIRAVLLNGPNVKILHRPLVTHFPSTTVPARIALVGRLRVYRRY
jgi:hypothetical protein